MTAKPTLTVLAGPTAVGKGTVCQYIREHYPQPRGNRGRVKRRVCTTTSSLWMSLTA